MPESLPPVPPSDEDLASALLELQREYLDSMPDRLRELREALARGGEDARSQVKRCGHRIAGTAATVGLDPLGLVGRALEHFASRGPWSPEDHAHAAAGVELLSDLTSVAAFGAPLFEVTVDPRFLALLPEDAP